MSVKDRILLLRRWYRGLPPPGVIVREAVSYFSVWNLLLLAVGSKSSLLSGAAAYSSLLCSVGGFYLTWVSPRSMDVAYLHVHLDFKETLLMDMLFHQLPRLYASSYRASESVLATRGVALLYLAWYGLEAIKTKYRLREIDILVVVLLHEFLFFCLHPIPVPRC
jgi:hypothetical protein